MITYCQQPVRVINNGYYFFQGLHCDFACLLFSHIVVRPSAQRVLSIIDSAVKIEKEFFANALPQPLGDMTLKSMCDYIEFCADRLLRELGYDDHYHTANPFDFMEMISLEGKSNFFERRVGEYRKFNVGTDISPSLTRLPEGALDLQLEF